MKVHINFNREAAMRITLLAYGSRGDIQPFLALALGLRQAGHGVRLAVPRRFAAWIAGYGLECAPLPGDPEVISRGLNRAGRNAIGQMSAIAGYVFSIAGPVARAAFSACGGADLVVHSFLFTAGGHAFARAHGIPDVSVQTFPMFAPTRAFPNPAAAWIPPGPLSYFSHWFAALVFRYGGSLGYSGLRRSAPDVAGLPLPWPFAHPGPRTPPLIFAFSPRVVPRPAEWQRPHIHLPGYFFLPEDAAERLDPGLEAFLAAGAPPVCVTFGSMIHPRAERTRSALREALARRGQRAVFLTGWGAGEPEWGGGGDVLFREAAPHGLLFPRCAAVIHHGGAGTTAAALRAGVPQLLLPHAADQPFWGRRVAALGVGPRPLDLKRLSTARLTAALEELGEPDLRARAAGLAAGLSAEDGVAGAVGIIELLSH